MSSRNVTATERDFESALATFGALDDAERVDALCMLAHDLTVYVRSILTDPPFSDEAVTRLRGLNQNLHHLTSCINPSKRRSPHPFDDIELLRGMVEDSEAQGLQPALLRSFERAIRNAADHHDRDKNPFSFPARLIRSD